MTRLPDRPDLQRASPTTRTPRILHCPDLVGGNPGSLAKAERTLGLNSWCVSLQPHPFGYACDQLLTHGGIVATELARWRLLGMALGDYDVIHFNFGQSTLPQRLPLDTPSRFPAALKRLYNLYARLVELRDLEWLKRRGKAIVVTYQGDDARQGEYLQSQFEISPALEAGYYSAESDRLKRERIRKFGRWADAIFALNPDLLHVLPAHASFLPYAHFDVSAAAPTPPPGNVRPVVLHAPSHRGVKGTRHVIEAANRLKSEGVDFELLLVEGVSHQEAMRLYARADVLVDQLLVGWYGGLAVELMALGKPVIAYIREGDLHYVPDEMRQQLPVISATPASVYDVLRQWLTVRRRELAMLGLRSRAYVERWHDPKSVAAVLKPLYERLSSGARSRSALS